MREPPRQRRLRDGRLHLQDGPIDLIIEASGDAEGPYAAAWRRFTTILDELCAELPLLRAPAGGAWPTGRVALRMARAVAPFARSRFITPMAAVAGAVAEEVLEAMTAEGPLARAYVNNGGDIALHLEPGETFSIGMIDRPDRPALFGRATIRGGDGVGGVATSGWRGRSFSLGVADAVTVLARTAAMADAAATMVANATDIPGCVAIERAPARELDPASDLGDRMVTVAVGALSSGEVDAALSAGVVEAELWRREGLIDAAALRLGEATRTIGRESSLRDVLATKQSSRGALNERPCDPRESENPVSDAAALSPPRTRSVRGPRSGLLDPRFREDDTCSPIRVEPDIKARSPHAIG